MAYLYMKKRYAKLIVLVGAFLGIMLLFSIGAVAEDINASMAVAPKQLTGTATVRVDINIVNISDSGYPLSVTLYDPAGKVCSDFGSGGTANLPAGSSQSYSGNWTVTQKELDAGRIIYSAKYTTTNEEGEKISASRPISDTISHNAAKALLNVKRFVEPGEKATPGQEVTIRYVIKNVGTVDVHDITISDPDIIDKAVTHDTLIVGDTTEMSYSFVAESDSKTTHAEITYKYEISGKTDTSKPMKADPAVTIDVEVSNLVVRIAGQQIVNPGTKVEITYDIENKSDLTFEQVRITDTLLGDIDSNISIGPKKTHQGKYSLTVNQTGTYQFAVAGVDSTGKDVIFQSNQLTIQTTDMLEDSMTAEVVPMVFDVVIEGDRDIIYDEPAEIIFRVKVTNNSAVAAKNVIVAAAGTTVKEYDSIEPGETVEFLKAFNASMQGQFQFTATAKDNTGEDNVSESNIFRVGYMPKPVAPATPTPEPTATPEPQAEDPLGADGEPQPFSQPENTTGSTSIIIYVLGALLVVIVGAVGVLFVVDQRRNKGGFSFGKSGGGSGAGSTRSKGQVRVIDTLERSTHRDYTRPAKKVSAGSKRVTPQPEEPLIDEPPVATGRVYTPPPRQEPANRRIEVKETEDDPFRAYDEMPAYEQEPVAYVPPATRIDEDDAAPYDAAQAYRRPAAVEAETETLVIKPEEHATPVDALDEDMADLYAPPKKPSQPMTTTLEDDGMTPTEDTSVFQSSYLSRIRNAPIGAGAVDLFEEEKPSERPSRSEEEAALLSGSTGQYRLSRRSASVRNTAERKPPREQAEDPEAFARKQRADRAKKNNRTNLANFYDDEEESTTPTPPPRKRR